MAELFQARVESNADRGSVFELWGVSAADVEKVAALQVEVAEAYRQFDAIVRRLGRAKTHSR